MFTVIGGFNSNQLLPQLDWALIAANPKVFCGYSDITALQSEMSRALLEQLMAKPELRGLPIIANVDFGHTSPMMTFPIGGDVEMTADPAEPAIRIARH